MSYIRFTPAMAMLCAAAFAQAPFTAPAEIDY
jgi:hypothetical protein